MGREQDSYFNLILEEVAIKRGQSVAELKVILGKNIAELKVYVWQLKAVLESDLEVESVLMEDDVAADGNIVADIALANEILVHMLEKYLPVEHAEAKDYLAGYGYHVGADMLEAVETSCANDNHVGGRYPGSWDGVDR